MQWLYTRLADPKTSPERKCTGKVRISLGGNVQQQLRLGLLRTQPSPPPRAVVVLLLLRHAHMCVYIHNEHKGLTISWRHTFKWPERSGEIRNEHWRMSPRRPPNWFLGLCISPLHGAVTLPSKRCVHACCVLATETLLRPSGSGGQCLGVSVTLLSSTEGLRD